MNITASDRASLLRLASSLPLGDESRRAILSGLKKADPVSDQFWKDFSALEHMSLFSGMAVASFMEGKTRLLNFAWLRGTANRAHAERAKEIAYFRKFSGSNPAMAEALPLLKVCQAAASATVKAQSMSPLYDSATLAKTVKRLLPLYNQLRSQYPTVAHLLDAPE